MTPKNSILHLSLSRALAGEVSTVPLVKGQAIPEGAHWITVHPHGDGSKGQPLLVQETHHGSGVLHVIGGAGGKLNYLRLRRVKSGSNLKESAEERAQHLRAERKAQIAADKANGTYEAKKAARESITNQRRKAERTFIQTVANSMGWKLPSHLVDDGNGQVVGQVVAGADKLSPEAQKRLMASQHRQYLAKARQAVSANRARLVADADARASAKLGVLPLDAPAEELGVSDLDPVRGHTSEGINHNFTERAAPNLKPEQLEEKVAEAHEAEGKSTDLPPGGNAAKMTADDIKAELAEYSALDPLPDLQARIVDAHEAVQLMKADKALRDLQRQARDANAELRTTTHEPKAYVLQAGKSSEEEIEAEVLDDLRTLRTRSLLAEVSKAGEDAIEPHVAGGAYGALNAVSQAAGGVSMLDRSVVDVLGVAGAAQVLAARMRADLGPGELEPVLSALEEHHVSAYTENSADVVERVQELHAAAREMEEGATELANAGGDSLALAELNQRRHDALADANRVLGRTLGENEGRAALVAAMKAPTKDLEVSLGTLSLESGITQLAALGLKTDDYKVERHGGNVIATVKADALAKLATPVDKENAQRVARNLAISRGEFDEDGWMPQGFAQRPDLALDLQPGVCPSIAKPFDAHAGDLAASLRDYIGGRIADGERAADVLADIQSADFFQKVGADRYAEYRAALDEVAPNKINGKQMASPEQLEPRFREYADAFAEKAGGGISPLHAQDVGVGPIAQEALHRALSDEPAGVAAYKPIGELSQGDRRALRDHFARDVAKASPEALELQDKLDKLDGQEPERYQQDMFGETVESPEWQAWQSARIEVSAKLKAAGLDWPGYIKAMHGRERAYAALQDSIRSRVSRAFVEHHNRLNPAGALKVGRAMIRNGRDHLGAIDPDARAARAAEEAKLIDALRERHAGKYASGAVADKLDALKEQKAAFEAAQMGLFGSGDSDMFGGDGDMFGAAPNTETQKPAITETQLGGDERFTAGHVTERRIAEMMGPIGKNFQPGKPVKLFHASMSGKDGAPRQRAIKYIAENKRAVMGLGVGSGKTGIGLGAFSHLHEQGKVKKGLFAVPSIVQGQFGAEALRFLQPGKYKWHCQPGASREERMAAYKDPDTHFTVVTHQALRDDLLHMAADHDKITTDEVSAKLAGMTQGERKDYMRGVLDHHGIAWDYIMADEAHGLLNREGRENSTMANAVQGMTDGANYYVHASGDPVKNDASEAFDLLAKMDAGRYSDRDAFMRKYGGDSPAAKEGLRRELARHLYAAAIKPNIDVKRTERRLDLTPAQTAAIGKLDKAFGALRVARLQGKPDIEAARAVSPEAFSGVPEDQHAEVAKQIGEAAGIMRTAAMRRIIDADPDGCKANEVLAQADARKGQPGVVFVRSLAMVDALQKKLQAAGHRVLTITGKDTADSKSDKIRAFNPDQGDREADIVVCSDAGATGANLQSGRWLLQVDTPDTAMTHAQRKGRIERVGQKNSIEQIDLIANHAAEDHARDRLARKYGLRETVTSPLESLDDTGYAHLLHLKQTQGQEQAGLF